MNMYGASKICLNIHGASNICMDIYRASNTYMNIYGCLICAWTFTEHWIYACLHIYGASQRCMNMWGACNICMNSCGASSTCMNINGASNICMNSYGASNMYIDIYECLGSITMYTCVFKELSLNIVHMHSLRTALMIQGAKSRHLPYARNWKMDRPKL